ncbi:unnamed protein product [Lampetra planeri]
MPDVSLQLEAPGARSETSGVVPNAVRHDLKETSGEPQSTIANGLHGDVPVGHLETRSRGRGRAALERAMTQRVDTAGLWRRAR